MFLTRIRHLRMTAKIAITAIDGNGAISRTRIERGTASATSAASDIVGA
jgi:hypothetical protein